MYIKAMPGAERSVAQDRCGLADRMTGMRCVVRVGVQAKHFVSGFQRVLKKSFSSRKANLSG